MPPMLDHAALVQNEDLVRIADGADAVARDQRRATGERLAQTAQDVRLGVGVHRAQRVVEEHDGRLSRHRAGERGALLLPTRQVDAAFAQLRVVSLAEALHGLVQLRQPARPSDRRLGRRGRVVLEAVAQVALDRLRKEQALLRHHADLAPELSEVELRDRHTVHEDRPLLRVEEAREQVQQRALARPDRPDDAERLPRRERERDLAQHPARRMPLGGRIVESHAAELDRAPAIRARGQWRGGGR